jgi:arylsulfatase A-like enzyme
MATLAELTGQTLIETDGISLLPSLLGKNEYQKKHEWLYFEYPENGGQIAIRMGYWKAIKTNVRMHPETPWQLFNLKNDSTETKDLASQQVALIRKMDEIVEKEHLQAHLQEWEFIHPKFPVKLVYN